MNKKLLLPTLALLFCTSIQAQQTKLTQYVNPMVGTGGHGHTFPGATVPFGMVQLSPDTRVDGSWDGCSGYHYSDSIIYGFSHTHLSGTGCSDYGDIMLMPTVGEPQLNEKKYASVFSHANEKAEAGYYAVKLNNGVNVELTSTTRVGFHKYTFPKTGKANIILDLTHRDKTLESSLKIVAKNRIEGMRRSEAWAKDQHTYFVAEFSKPFINYAADDSGKIVTNFTDKLHTSNIKAWFQFNSGDVVLVKVGISTVSIAGAYRNMDTELPGWDFDTTKARANAMWEKELHKIVVQSDHKEYLQNFYTALYHTMIQPNVNMDIDGQYRGRDNQVHKADGFINYSVFSLWDTFRAANPLYTIIQQNRTNDFIRTFLAQYKDGGRLPVWELAGNETDCMIGYHSVSIITDAAAKGIRNFDMALALEAMKKSATWPHLGLPAYMEHGSINMDDEHESVSKTLEYAYDDWCIAQFAKMNKVTADYDTYMKRSQYWKNSFDNETGFMRPKKNGGWLKPFEPREVNNNYTEGNAWQYAFFVPQDIPGLIEKMGGNDKFEQKLDELFTTTSQTTGREQADITGLIGQYAHGNEPSHHMAYLYNYVGKPSKTQQRIHQIVSEFYKPTPDGLIGNEDCGQMSAWYVLSSLGFYMVCPGSTQYVIGTPLFKEAKFNLENGKSFTIKADNVSESNYFIQSTKLNGNDYPKNVIDYNDITKGGGITFAMAAKPRPDSDYKPIETTANKNLIVETPVISAKNKVFKNSETIEITSVAPNCKLYYSLDGAEPNTLSKIYGAPFTVDATTTIKALAINGKGERSFVALSKFYKMPHNWTIKINGKYNPQYTADGDEGIIDGVYGSENWRKGDWQGYQSQDFECVIDLGKTANVSSLSADFLQDTGAWIVFPKKVEYYISTDNINFDLAGSVENTIKPEDLKTQTQNIKLNLQQVKTARYVKIKAYNYGHLPAWHAGAGGDAFIFVDEVDVK